MARHPSEYTTQPFGGFHVMVVDPGTTITDERTGASETVDGRSAVRKGAVIYCTKSVFDAMKAQTN